MSKKFLIIGGVVVVILIGAASGYFLVKGRLQSSDTSLPEITNSKEVIKGDLIYKDESGFSFSYPRGVTVSDKTPEDDSYYSLLELAKGAIKMTFTIRDTSVKSPDEWIKGEDGFSQASLVGATSLGGIGAKQYSNGEKLLTIGVDQGISYALLGPKDSGFWEDTENVVAGSFTQGTSSSNQGAGDDTIYEVEEVVQ